VRSVSCNLCGADDYTIVFPKGFAQLHRIVRCNKCGLMYANPQELIDCEEFKSSERPEVFDLKAGQQYFEKQHAQLPDNLRALRVLNDLLPKRGKLLEIGSFLGIFLDQIRAAGWSAVGLEPDPGPANYARSHYGHEVVSGTLPNPNLREHDFDAVIMLHVIEHMPDPAANVREIRRLLKPGGVLVVETPRFDSLLFKILGRRERSIHNCEGHIFFFTVPSLRQLVEKQGFEVIRTEMVGRTLTLDRFIYNLCLITRSQKLMRWASRIAVKLGLNKLKFYVNVRDMQRIYARAK
jgi:2-polyprenyl-3-methyl-5-hydroxy-6-metoxy-1,4-benzoquinol methylase